MGYNSGLIILNDSLHVIAENALSFTEQVVGTIQRCGGGLREGQDVDISIGGHANAATLFHMQHADVHDAYLFGGNTARRLPTNAPLLYSGYRKPEEANLDVLKGMADALGFRLVRKSGKAKQG